MKKEEQGERGPSTEEAGQGEQKTRRGAEWGRQGTLGGAGQKVQRILEKGRGQERGDPLWRGQYPLSPIPHSLAFQIFSIHKRPPAAQPRALHEGSLTPSTLYPPWRVPYPLHSLPSMEGPLSLLPCALHAGSPTPSALPPPWRVPYPLCPVPSKEGPLPLYHASSKEGPLPPLPCPLHGKSPTPTSLYPPWSVP